STARVANASACAAAAAAMASTIASTRGWSNSASSSHAFLARCASARASAIDVRSRLVCGEGAGSAIAVENLHHGGHGGHGGKIRFEPQCPPRPPWCLGCYPLGKYL